MLLRWFLPVVAVLPLLASSLTAFAGTGVVGSSECCCPDPDTCKCHDHDDGPQPASGLERCGGEARLVAPHVAAAPCLGQPTDLERPPTGALPCDLLPPGFVTVMP